MGLMNDFNSMKKTNGDLAETETIAAKLAVKYGFTQEEVLDFVYCERYEDDAPETEPEDEDEDEDE